MRGLAIETSSRVGSVALVLDGTAVAEETFPHGLQHAARIVPAIDELCRRLDWGSGDLREIYVSVGPGSFTGLRIGITLAKTLAFVTGAAVVAVPSCDVLVENVPAEATHTVVVLDARRDMIFAASYERLADGWAVREAAHLDSLDRVLERSPRPVYLIGEGIPNNRRFIPESAEGIILTKESLWTPRAGVVARLGYAAARLGRFIDPMILAPVYIRRPEAEEKLEGGGAAMAGP